MNHSWFYRQRIWWLIALVLLVQQIPLVQHPFNWMETFFHEISHGIAALLTGGIVIAVSLNYNGSGLCLSQGGIASIVAFSGYLGSSLWGLLIFLLADRLNRQSSMLVVVLLVALMLWVAVFWASGLSTYVILGIMIAVFGFYFRFFKLATVHLLVSFIGLYVLLNSLSSPLVLLDGKSIGDGAALTVITHLPEIVWVVLWLAIALACLAVAVRSTYRGAPGRVF